MEKYRPKKTKSSEENRTPKSPKNDENFGIREPEHHIVQDYQVAYNAPSTDVDRFDETSRLDRSKVKSIVKIIGQILEVREDKVVLNCLLDSSQKQFQVRRFDKAPFLGAVHLALGNFVEITILTMPGERRFLFNMHHDHKAQQIFQEASIFEELIGSSIFDPLPSTHDDHL